MREGRNNEKREYKKREQNTFKSMPDQAQSSSLQPHHAGKEPTHEKEQLHSETMNGVVDNLKVSVLKFVLGRPDRSLVKGKNRM
tara:strand:- start:1296 stop:1547 length:252 start_codon:yes stop_codon:yes gene_type:complete